MRRPSRSFWPAAPIPKCGTRRAIPRCTMRPGAATRRPSMRFWPAAPIPTRGPRKGQTPLHYAARLGHAAAIDALLAGGADPNARTTKGPDPAALCGQARPRGGHRGAPGRRRRSQGADDQEGPSPLHAAAQKGHAAAIAALLADSRTDPNARDKHGITPLHWAAGGGRPEAIAALLAGGADPNARAKNGWTPLHWRPMRPRGGYRTSGRWRRSQRAGQGGWHNPAALGGRVAMRRPSMRFWPAAPIPTRGTRMAGPRCTRRPREATRRPSQRFWKAAPIPTRGTRMAGPRCTMRRVRGPGPAVWRPSRRFWPTAPIPNARNKYGWTPLHYAAFRGHAAAIDALLVGGADAKARARDGRIPFDLISDNSPLVGTPAYWRLHEARWD